MADAATDDAEITFDASIAGRRAEADGGSHVPGTNFAARQAFAGTLTLIYGRMVADNEVLAFGSLGIPGRTLAWPAIVLAIVLSGFSAWVTTTVVRPSISSRRAASMWASASGSTGSEAGLCRGALATTWVA